MFKQGRKLQYCYLQSRNTAHVYWLTVIRAVFVKFQQGGWLSASPEGPTLEGCKLPQRGGAEPRKILNLVHFGTWKSHQDSVKWWFLHKFFFMNVTYIYY